MIRRAAVVALGTAAVVAVVVWVGSGRYALMLTSTHLSVFVSRGALHVDTTWAGTGLYGRRFPAKWRFGRVGAPGWNHTFDLSWGNRRLTAELPLWVPAAVFLALFGVAWAPSWWQRRTRRIRGQCLACGYTLTGLPSARCPECGATGRVTPD